MLTGNWPFDGDYEADFKARVMKGAFEPLKAGLFENKKQEADINELFKCIFIVDSKLRSSASDIATKLQALIYLLI